VSAVGSHIRVAPEDFRISTRVVTSNVRQLASSANKALRRGKRDAGAGQHPQIAENATVHERILHDGSEKR